MYFLFAETSNKSVFPLSSVFSVPKHGSGSGEIGREKNATAAGAMNGDKVVTVVVVVAASKRLVHFWDRIFDSVVRGAFITQCNR